MITKEHFIISCIIACVLAIGNAILHREYSLIFWIGFIVAQIVNLIIYEINERG